jgi:hypothetical protein
MVHTVGVVFSSGFNSQVYHYLTDIEGIKVGDKIIVDSPSDGYVAVKVQTVHKNTHAAKATKYIVNTIDDTAYKTRLEAEKRKAEIVKKLEKKRKEVEELAVYQWLAMQDSEAASLLNELKSIK